MCGAGVSTLRNYTMFAVLTRKVQFTISVHLVRSRVVIYQMTNLLLLAMHDSCHLRRLCDDCLQANIWTALLQLSITAFYSIGEIT